MATLPNAQLANLAGRFAEWQVHEPLHRAIVIHRGAGATAPGNSHCTRQKSSTEACLLPRQPACEEMQTQMQRLQTLHGALPRRMRMPACPRQPSCLPRGRSCFEAASLKAPLGGPGRLLQTAAWAPASCAPPPHLSRCYSHSVRTLLPTGTRLVCLHASARLDCMHAHATPRIQAVKVD